MESSERKAREKREYRERLEEQASKYLLPTSAIVYVRSVGKKLSDFDQRNVCATYLERYDLEGSVLKCKKQMIKRGKALGAEVVVSVGLATFYHKSSYRPIDMWGTALIRKKKTEE